MKKLLLILFVVTIIPFNSFCQRNYELMIMDNSVNFYDACRASDQYFEINDKNTKGSGWKQYQRWKHQNENKFYPTGNRDSYNPFTVVNSFKKFSNTFPLNNNSQLNGWKELGPLKIDTITAHHSVGMGWVSDIYVSPIDTNILYLGSKSGGFWKSLDGGLTWQVTTDFLHATGVNTIAVSPTNSDSILINIQSAKSSSDITGGASHGIYRSTDGGNTWTLTNFNPLFVMNFPFRIQQITYHPLVSNLIFILTTNGLFRSDDNLNTWSLVSTVISDSWGSWSSQIEFHPTDPNIIYSHSYSNNGSLHVSNDMGFTFSNISLPSYINILPLLSVSKDCPDCLYLASNNSIWMYQNNMFNLLDSAFNNPIWGSAINDLDTSSMILGGVNVHSSLDGGKTFSPATAWLLSGVNTSIPAINNHERFNFSTNYVHADTRCAKSVNGSFYIGTDGFFCKSNDNGLTWKILNKEGTGIRENYKFGISQSNHFRTIIGSQDNGTSIKNKFNWIELRGGDGMEAIIHPLNHDWMFGNVQSGGGFSTRDGGMSLHHFTYNSNGSWESPVAYSTDNHMNIYEFKDSIYVSNDFGSSSNPPIAHLYSPNKITQAAIAENNSQIIIIALPNQISKSIDGGNSFYDITNNLPNFTNYISDIAFDPNNDDNIIITSSSHATDSSKVWLTQDGGNTWQNITYNLFNMPIHSVVIDHTDSSNIYLGGEIGVYIKSLNSNLWSLYNPLLPNMSIEELEIVYASNTIRAATWGRGLWEFDLVGRNNFPSILTTRITNMPTDTFPQEYTDQYITSVISYDNQLSSVFVEWSTNMNTNIIPMTNTQDSTWVSQTSIPNHNSGTKIYFKVFAVGNNNDTTETYRFMYTVRAGSGNNLSGLFNTSDVSCFGGNDGSVTINIIGGNSSFNYLWSNGQQTQTINNLSAGNYSCTATDIITGNSITSYVVISQPMMLTSTANTVDVSCYGGNDGVATLTLSGGTGALTVDWFGINPNALPVGTHNYAVTDTNGCSTTSNVVISQPLILSSTSNTSDVSCYGGNDGVATLTLSGGTGALTVDWFGMNPNSLSAGTYNYTITDTNGCFIASDVIISQPNQLIASITQNNASLIVNSLGGTPNFVYSWVGPFGFISSNQNIFPPTNGQYTVLVTDANGCESQTNFNVTWIIATSLESINILNLNIFPNPSDNDFNIEFISLISQNLTLRLFNSVGDIIFIDNLESYIGEYKKQISLKEYAKAIYFLEIKTDYGVVNKKLTLQ